MFRHDMSDEHGFTLVELLISIMVSGIILVALTAGFIVTAKGTKGAHEYLVESHDAQLLAAHFPSDVQSADPALLELDPSVATDPATQTGCSASSPPPAGSDNMLRLQWTELTNGSTLTAFSASYRREVPSGADHANLVRYYCTGATPITSPPPLSASDRNVLLQAALAGEPATSGVVAHDLSISQLPPDFLPGTRIISWVLSTSLKPTHVEDAPYDFNLSASMRKVGTSAAAPAAGSFAVSGMPPSVTAGSPFNVTVTLAGFSGPKTLTWSGPRTAPNGAAATYVPASGTSVTFNASGQATVSVTLTNAETTSLNVTAGTITGQSSAFTVSGGAAASLAFTNCSGDNGAPVSCTPNVTVGNGANKYMEGFVSVRDAYGNAAVTTGSSWSVVVAGDPAQPTFVVSGSPVTVTGPAMQSSTPFRVTHTSSTTPGPATISASSVPPLTSAFMTVSKN